jgi:hypothetical protein
MTTVFRTPFIDRRVKTPASRYEGKECIMQSYMALFLSKPELYERINLATGPDEQQDYFFNQFQIFASKYIEINDNISNEYLFDMEYYFTSLCKYDVNVLNVAGGEKRSAGAKKKMLSKHHTFSDNRNTLIDYFQKKYNWDLSGAVIDPRLFLGHSEPWKKASPELLNLQNWNEIIINAYDDETLTTPFPEDLNKDLVPLKIRNKVYTAWKNKQNKLFEMERHKKEIEYKKQIEREDNETNNEKTVVKTLTPEEIEIENLRKKMEETRLKMLADIGEDEDW